MAKKKEQKVTASQADAAQVQAEFEQYHELARKLRKSQNQQQVEAVLASLNALSEASQLALLKLLSKEHNLDAADVLLAINELSPTKSIRKEARRSLIHLEEARIYPQWSSPIDRTPVIDRLTAEEVGSLDETTRFWKGYVTNSRDVGEAQLLLLWEQGEGYRDVRVLGFLLEFWHDGVKDFFSRVESKRRFEKFLGQTQSQVELVDCSLAKGRSLIEEALAVNQKYGTRPHRDFNLHRSLVNQLVLENPDISALEVGEELLSSELDAEEDTIDPDLEPAEVVTEFIEAWVDEDFELAYNYLASESSLREGLTEEEWSERREQWLDTSVPGNMRIDFVYEHEAQKPRLWLPNPFKQSASTAQKEIEVGWSMQLSETEWASANPTQNAPLPELPLATAVYPITKRHWFLTSYTLIKEENGWRIQSMTDEGTNARGLSIDELQKRISDNNLGVEKITQEHQPTDPDADIYFNEMMWRSTQNLAYTDILLTKLPLDQTIYIESAAQAITFGDLERSLVYLEQAAKQFPEQRAGYLQKIAAMQLQLSERYADQEDQFAESDDLEFEDEDEDDFVEADEDADEAIIVDADNIVEADEAEDEDADENLGKRFRAMAEATAREALTLEESIIGHILLAQALLQSGDARLDEAEEQLHAAQTFSPEGLDAATIEASLGDIHMLRQQYEEALAHFRYVLELQPEFPNAWFNLGRAYKVAGHTAEAIDAFKQAIVAYADNAEAYAELANLYIEDSQVDEARTLLEEGIDAHPDEAPLITILAMTYIDSDIERAEELVEQAESIDPDSMLVMVLRQIINFRRQEEKASRNKPKKRR